MKSVANDCVETLQSDSQLPSLSSLLSSSSLSLDSVSFVSEGGKYRYVIMETKTIIAIIATIAVLIMSFFVSSCASCLDSVIKNT